MDYEVVEDLGNLQAVNCHALSLRHLSVSIVRSLALNWAATLTIPDWLGHKHVRRKCVRFNPPPSWPKRTLTSRCRSLSSYKSPCWS